VADDLLGGGVGGEEDSNAPAGGPELAAGVEAFAAAIAAIASRQDPEVARDTSAFLKKQSQLVEIQARHLEDEHPLRLQAAEYVYAESQPAHYVYYLANVSRFDEAIAFARNKFPGADAWLRGELLNSWANALDALGGSRDQVMGLYRARFNSIPRPGLNTTISAGYR
jgi:hypothetical protein